MNQSVRAGATVKLTHVDGNLTVGRKATISSEAGGKIVVTGSASFEGAVTIQGDFECQSMRLEGRGFGPTGDVTVHGDLLVHQEADIDASANISGSINAGQLDIGGHLTSGRLTTKRLRVGGHIETRGRLEADQVDIGGHMTVLDQVKIGSMRVGGHAKVGGGSIGGEIRVRGHFTTTNKLSFGHIEVFGHLTLPGGSAGDKVSALGRVVFQGDASCKELEVIGKARVNGNLEADTVVVKGELRVSAAAYIAHEVKVWGTAEVREAIHCQSLVVGGKVTAETISAQDAIEMAGEITSRQGLKAKSIVVGTGSKVVGPIVAGRVEVGGSSTRIESELDSVSALARWGSAGRPTRVGDVYGETVVIGPRTIARQVFGEVVEIGPDSTVQQVTYTRQIRLPAKYTTSYTPIKAAKLPEPPL